MAQSRQLCMVLHRLRVPDIIAACAADTRPVSLSKVDHDPVPAILPSRQCGLPRSVALARSIHGAPMGPAATAQGVVLVWLTPNSFSRAGPGSAGRRGRDRRAAVFEY